MTKHTPFTPGPWRQHVINSCGHRAVIALDETHVCTLPVTDLDSGEHRANAHLIAAAPDMLSALEVLVGWESASLYEKDAIRNFDRARGCKNTRSELSDEILSLARAAIAKAKGEA